MTHIPTAAIFGNQQITAYVGAMFFYGEQNDLLVVSTIQNGMVFPLVLPILAESRGIGIYDF